MTFLQFTSMIKIKVLGLNYWLELRNNVLPVPYVAVRRYKINICIEFVL